MTAHATRYHAALAAAEAAETTAQQAVARTLRMRMILLDELRRMQQTLEESKRSLGAGLAGRVDLTAVGAVARYCGATAGRGRELVSRLALLERELGQGRAALAEASRRRRSLELLQEKAAAEARRRERRAEASALDDLASTRFFEARRVAQAGARLTGAGA